MRYWKRIDNQGAITTVESYSHDLDIKGAVEITKEEYDSFVASLPPIKIEPVRDIAKEVDDLKTRIAQLEKV